MPLIYPFRAAFGNDDAIVSVLVKLTTGVMESGCFPEQPFLPGESGRGRNGAWRTFDDGGERRTWNRLPTEPRAA